MLKNNEYYYNDTHMYFYFNNKYSKNYNLFIINESDELELVNETESNIEFVTPADQNHSYLASISQSQKKFTYDVAAEGLTLPRYKEMMLWLQKGQLGFLVKDDNPYWGYNVIVEDISNAEVQYDENDNLIVSFTISFSTVDDYLAKPLLTAGRHWIDNNDETLLEPNEKTELQKTALNEFGIPEIAFIEKNDKGITWYINNVSNSYSFINFILKIGNQNNNIFKLQINDNNVFVYDLSLQQEQNINVWGKYGFVLINDRPIEQNEGFNSGQHFTSNFKLESNTPLSISSDDIIIEDNRMKIKESSKSLIDNYIVNSNNDKIFVCFSKIEPSSSVLSKYNNGIYPLNEQSDFIYNLQYKSYIYIINNYELIPLEDEKNILEDFSNYSICIGTYNKVTISSSNIKECYIEVWKNNNL